MTTETFALLCLDVYCEKKPKTCGACGYFNQYSQPCKLDCFSQPRTRACSQAISRKTLFEKGY